MAKLKITGVAQVSHNLEKVEGQVIKELAQGLYTEGNFIMTKAKILTPVDTGTLRSTGYITMPQFKRGKSVMEVEMGFGGASAGYAVYVHENLDAYHAPPTMAKFLEIPFMQATSGMNTRLSAYIKKVL